MSSRTPSRAKDATDDRFAKSRNDPRFRAPAKTRPKKKFQTDPRFADDDPAFQDGDTQFDKYGRWIPPVVETPIPENQNSKDAEKKGALEMQRMVGLCASTSETESESDDSMEEEGEAAWGVGAWAVNPDEAVSESAPTSRLAVVDMDWSKITAVDLLATFRSFVPDSHNAVKKVTVYLSDYGLERLPKEDATGPSALGLFKDTTTEEHTSDKEEEVEPEVLRKYEKSRLRYYYAVVECGSIQVAEFLMQELDGSEFESSQCVLDLRYIPEDESFDDRPIRDAADAVSADFEGRSFECNALQKTNVKLTWDDDDDRRLQVVRRRFTEEDLQDQDFQAYLASSESEAESDDETQKIESRKKYASLMKNLNLEDNPRRGGKTREMDSGSDDEVSESGSDNCLENLLEVGRQKKVQKDGRKIWSRYEKRKSECVKRQKRRGQFRIDSSASDSDSGLSSVEEAEEEGKDVLLEDPDEEREIWIDVPKPNPVFTDDLVPTSNPVEDKNEAKKAQSNVELLMMDDQMLQDARHGLTIEKESTKEERGKGKRKLSRRERVRQSINKKKQKHTEQQEEENPDFKVNIDDPRFANLLTSADFVLDPTDPAFKRTSGADIILQEVNLKNKIRRK